VDEIVLTVPADPYLTLRALASYSGCSVRWLRDRLVDGQHPLPCYRLPSGKVLVRRSAFDAWMTRYQQIGAQDVTRVVAEALDGLR
jgi:predicted DNA-binding transcriptional regulator AlpA